MIEQTYTLFAQIHRSVMLRKYTCEYHKRKYQYINGDLVHRT